MLYSLSEWCVVDWRTIVFSKLGNISILQILTGLWPCWKDKFQFPFSTAARQHEYLHHDVFSNLAQPEWLLVGCKENFLVDVFCVTNYTHRKKSVFHNFSQQHLDNNCLQYEFKVKDQGCLSILEPTNFRNRFSNGVHWKYHTFIKDIQKIEFLFSATASSFPPILAVYEQSTLEFVKIQCGKYYSKVKYLVSYLQENDLSQAALLIFTKHGPYKPYKYGNLVSCNSGYFVSSFYAFDLEPDCALSFDPVSIWNPLQCANFYKMTHTCFSITSNAIHTKNASLVFKTDPEEKSTQSNFASNSKILQCSKPTELYCNLGKDEACFNMSHVCVFRLGGDHSLIPCKSGGHMEMCEHFECNMKYKCPGFYCIPFGYVCNGRWDCPSGKDELDKHECGQNRLCFNMFRCRESQICIGFRDVCDGFVDCNQNDDELLCDLKHIECSESCICINYAIACKSKTLHKDLKREMPYLVMSLSSARISSCEFLTAWQQIKFLNISGNSLTEVCGTVGISNYNLIYFVAPRNKIHRLSQNCFAHVKKLHTIHLMSNEISTVQQKSFNNLSQIWSIDLSCNQIDTLKNVVFFRTNSLKVLSLKGNPLSNIYPSSIDKVSLISLTTDNYQLCCFVLLPSSCNAIQPGYTHCSDLFPKESMALMASILASVIVFTNIVSFINAAVAVHKGKQVPFFIAVYCLNMCDFICGLFLLLLFNAHRNYQKAYLFNEQEWRGTLQCLTVFVLSFIFAFSSAMMLVILSLSRCMVVKFPMESIFKQKSFLKKLVSISNISVVLLGIGLGIIQKTVFMRMPMILCSPVIDPTHNNIIVTILTFIVSWFHIVCFAAVITLNALLIHTKMKKSVILISQKRSNSGTIVQLTLMSLSNLVCWIPTSIVVMVSFFLSEYSVDLVIWATIILTPINSVSNPIIFLIVHVKNHMSITYA